ncbi:MAG: right-handed parallel beta-helix repeat-containing protein, partial [Myxococcota bacterium]
MLILALPSFAATIVVEQDGSGDADTVMGGVALAAAGDVVELGPGTYVEDVDFQAKAISIEGRAGAGVTILQGTGGGPVVRVDSGEGAGTRLAGVTVTGGVADAGGGIYVKDATLALDGVIVSGNTATDGGGVVSSGGTLTLANVEVRGNVATDSGAGVYVFEGSFVATDTVIAENEAAEYGGGLVLYGEGAATDLSLEGNTAGNTGGNGYVGANLTCVRCTVSGGVASSAAGLFVGDGAEVTLTAGDFTGNTSSEEGGGLFAYDGARVLVESATFSGNSATFGAGVLVWSSDFQAYWTTFADNLADGGGGVYADGSTLFLQNTVFTGNEAATSNGGGLAADTCIVDVLASVFAVNAGYSGGAVHVGGESLASLQNVTMVENASSGSAGGVRVAGTSLVSIFNTIVAWSSDGSGISAAATAFADVQYGDLYVNEGGATSDALADPTGTSGNLAVDPGFVSFADDGVYADDLHLLAGSALVDAGHPDILDADGSPSDIGAYGGPAGDAWEDGDGDADGSPDSADCDDDDPDVSPGATEACNGVDDDCDGETDEGCVGDTGDTGDTG